MDAVDIKPRIRLLTRDVIAAITDRPRLPEAERAARAEAALRQIEAFEPSTDLEIIMAGQAVLFSSLIVDSVHDATHATTPDLAYRHRQQAIALGRAHLSYVKEISRRRAKAEQPAKHVAPPAVPGAAAAQPSTNGSGAQVQVQVARPLPMRADAPAPANPPPRPGPAFPGNAPPAIADTVPRPQPALTGT